MQVKVLYILTALLKISLYVSSQIVYKCIHELMTVLTHFEEKKMFVTVIYESNNQLITIWSCEVNGYCKVYLSSEKKRKNRFK